MVPTHCPNCGAPITENNSEKFCTYCGGKLPEPDQMIINNNDNREIHYHTTIIQQAPASQPTTAKRVQLSTPPKDRPLPKEERIKEKSKTKIIAFITAIALIIIAIASHTAILALIAIVPLTMSIIKPNRTNYCPHCFYKKELWERKCKHCGKIIESSIIRIAAALMADSIALFIAVAISA